MKICIFTGYFLPHLGGVEQYTYKLANELHKLGHKITIVTSNDNNYKEYEKTNVYELIRLPVYEAAKDRYPILKFLKIKKVLKRLEPYDFDYMIIQTRFYLSSPWKNQKLKKEN